MRTLMSVFVFSKSMKNVDTADDSIQNVIYKMYLVIETMVLIFFFDNIHIGNTNLNSKINKNCFKNYKLKLN